MKRDKHNQHRRNLLKAIAGLGGAAAVGKSLPERWTKPVVDAVLLPAHAATSGLANGTYSVTVNNSVYNENWLDYLVPRAYAVSALPGGITGYTVCFDVTDLAADVSVYIQDSSTCYVYSGSIPDVTSFSNVALTHTGGSNSIAVTISGAISDGGISGTLNTGLGNLSYAAVLGACSPVCTPTPA